MAAIHEALQALGPTAFADVPTADADLTTYLRDTFDRALLLVDSVPPPPSPPDATPSSTATRPRSTSTVSLSSARSAPAAPDREALQGAWGKPVKLSAKENPLGVSVYKLAGQDGRGAWFARRSVHEGLPFAAWRDGLRQELPLGWTPEAPGDQVRSIQGQRAVEERRVAGVGDLAVYHLAAQFPGPSARRDFVVLLLTATAAAEEGGPRHFMVVSKPCEHDEVPPASGSVRAQYESVEFVREVPQAKSSALRKTASAVDLPSTGLKDEDKILEKSRSAPDDKEGDRRPRSRGKNISFAEPLETTAQDPPADSPPAVEWIHVTRSDPGGNVPRFMVERGTPAGICSDASKFVDWISGRDAEAASKPGEAADTEGTAQEAKVSSSEENAVNGTSKAAPSSLAPDSAPAASQSTLGGYLQAATSSATAAFEAYAPRSLSHRLASSQDLSEAADAPSTPSSISSSGSFASADEELALSPSPSAKSTASGASAAKASSATAEERAAAQLAKKRAQLDAQLEKVRAQDSRERASTAEREAERRRKAEEKHARELAKAEAAHAKALKDARARHEREVRHAAQREEKARRKEAQAREKREREDVRRQLELVTKERDGLRKENERLASDKERLEKENEELRAGAGGAGERAPLAEKN